MSEGLGEANANGQQLSMQSKKITHSHCGLAMSTKRTQLALGARKARGKVGTKGFRASSAYLLAYLHAPLPDTDAIFFFFIAHTSLKTYLHFDKSDPSNVR